MATLRARIGGAWVDVTQPPPVIPDEVVAGTVPPTDPAADLWVDSTDPAVPVLKAKDGTGAWIPLTPPAPIVPDEVWIGPTDPRIADPTGTWELWIYNPPPPYLGSVDVASLTAGAMTQVTVMGQDFVAGESVATFMGVDQPNYGAGSATKMYVEITVPAGTTGDQPITVRNPDGQESSPYLIPVV